MISQNGQNKRSENNCDLYYDDDIKVHDNSHHLQTKVYKNIFKNTFLTNRNL